MTYFFHVFSRSFSYLPKNLHEIIENLQNKYKILTKETQTVNYFQEFQRNLITRKEGTCIFILLSHCFNSLSLIHWTMLGLGYYKV